MPSLRRLSSLRTLGLLAWAGLVATGFGLAWRYEATPGRAAAARDWPAGSRIARDAARPTVVQFVHPECPCSRAGLEEIADLVRRRPGRLRLVVALVGAIGLPGPLAASANARLAASIPGAEVVFDADGREARRFGAATSGQTFVFSPGGEALFRGGVTIARGHYGRSRGLDALAALADGRRAPAASAPVYGCALGGTR